MEIIKLTATVDATGTLHLNLPTHLINQQVEVIVVLQPIPDQKLDALGWPVGYFEATYGILADDPIERADQGTFEIRESIE